MTVEDLALSSKVLAIGIKDFSLPKFGIYAQAYSAENSNSPFTSLMRILPYQKALPVENPLMVNFVFFVSYGSPLSGAKDF